MLSHTLGLQPTCRMDGNRTRNPQGFSLMLFPVELPQPMSSVVRTHSRNAPCRPVFNRDRRAAGRDDTVALLVNHSPLVERLKRRRRDSNPLDTVDHRSSGGATDGCRAVWGQRRCRHSMLDTNWHDRFGSRILDNPHRHAERLLFACQFKDTHRPLPGASRPCGRDSD